MWNNIIQKSQNLRSGLQYLSVKSTIRYLLILRIIFFISITPVRGQSALKYLNKMNNTRGFIIHIECNGGDLTAQLGLNNNNIVQGLDKDIKDVNRARSYIQSKGDYGRISIEHFNGNNLTYIDNIANLIISDGKTGVSQKEILRVLQPLGMAIINGKKIIKPRPGDIDEWTHYLHGPDNNAVADDNVVAPPKGLQWVNGPLWSRAHTTLAGMTSMVSAKGRVFSIEDRAPIQLPRMPGKYTLVARDGFNGNELWKFPFPDWELITHWMNATPVQLSRRLVAAWDTVYTTPGISAPVTAFNGRTGDIIKTYKGTEMAQEIIFYDNILYLVVGDRMKPYGDKLDHYKVDYTFDKEHYSPKRLPKKEPKSLIMAVDTKTGRKIWEISGAITKAYQGTTLAVNKERVLFQTAEELVCVDRKKGSLVWKNPSPVFIGRDKNASGASPTLVLHKDKIYRADAKKITAFSLKDGKMIWEAPSTGLKPMHHVPPDLFIAKEALWTHFDLNGYDLTTGEKIKVRGETRDGPMGHDRCYRNKATGNYIINSKTGGSDFSFLGKDKSRSHAWVRGTCSQGIMPCNGLLYAPQHACSCAYAAKLYGFNTLNGRTYNNGKKNILKKGPAYGVKSDKAGHARNDWPTYRQEISRTGNAKTKLGPDIKKIWRTKIGKPGSIVIADNKLFVPDIDAHTIYCLDSQDGKIKWSFTAGARIDSPPTYYRGVVLFGSHDGWVYCLMADTGKMRWRFRGAPNDMRTIAFEQPESLWPVHGSILILDGTAYFTAGRSSFLNKGIYIYGVNPVTGKKIYETKIYGPFDKDGEAILDKDLRKDIQGNKSDILVSDGEYIYLRHMAFKKDLTAVDRTKMINEYILTISGFLDDSGHHRSYWTVGKIFHYDVKLGKHVDADMLVMDGKNVYGIRGYPSGRSPKNFNPTAGGFTLFSLTQTDKRLPPLKVIKKKRLRKTKKKGKGKAKLKTPLLLDNAKPEPDWEYRYPENWSSRVQVNGKAILKSGDLLYIAGNPNEYPKKDIYKAVEGRMEGLLLIVSAHDGKTVKKYKLDAPPVWNSMAAADKKLFISLKNGYVECWK